MKTSAGLLAFRRRDGALEVFLIHPGGPFHVRKDDGHWSIPKGALDDDEDALAAARREFREETGFDVEGDLVPLGSVKQRGGKVVHAWAFETDFDATQLVSNTFEVEWPPKSGRMQEYPEADRGEWFSLENARRKMLPGQVELLSRLETATA